MSRITGVMLLLAALSAPGLAPATAAAQSLRPVPTLEARVTDQTGTLTAAQQAQLEAKLAEFESRKGAQIAVLIVPSTAPEAIEQYSIRVVDAWKLGRTKPDDGALLLVARDDRALRIEVGRGLEGVLTDLVSRRIIDDTITPLFRQGDFYGGISAGLEQVMRVVDGEPLPEPDRGWSRGPSPGDALPLLIAAFFIASVVLRALLGRALGALATGAATGALAWFLVHLLPVAMFAGIAGFVFALLFGAARGGRWSNLPRGGGWGGGLGGGWGGGGGGSWGGGGFSGGGGSFGGGGASGRW